MPVLKILPNGMTASVGHIPGNHERAKRGETKGWTLRATKGNRHFLWSVKANDLDGQGWAITLTVRDKIPSATDWANLRRRWVKRMERRGMIRLHWVTEWQRRGVPHLHGAIWFPQSAHEGQRPNSPDHPARFIVDAWLEVAGEYGAGARGQDVRIVYGVPGWFEYLAKHAARSAANYQRSPENIPAGWRKTGRMWGHVGEWPTREAMEVSMNYQAFYRYRRLVIRYQISRSREKGDRQRVAFLRRYLQASQEVSAHRGIGEWVPQSQQLAMIAAVASMPGSEVQS